MAADSRPDGGARYDRARALERPGGVNTKIRLLTRVAFGFRSPDALIALAMLSLGDYQPQLPGRNHPQIQQ